MQLSNYDLTIYFVKVDLAYLVHHVLVVKSDESESPVSVGDLVVSQHGLLDLAELLKIGLDVLKAGRRGQSAHEDLPGPHYQLGIGLPGHRNFRLHKLSIQLLGHKTNLRIIKKEFKSDNTIPILKNRDAMITYLVNWVLEYFVDGPRVTECDEPETSRPV